MSYLPGLWHHILQSGWVIFYRDDSADFQRCLARWEEGWGKTRTSVDTSWLKNKEIWVWLSSYMGEWDYFKYIKVCWHIKSGKCWLCVCLDSFQKIFSLLLLGIIGQSLIFHQQPLDNKCFYSLIKFAT